MEFDIELASYTDIGKIREKNEDSVLIAPELCLAIVADGMGGHNAGEVASNLAVSIVRQTLDDIKDKTIIIPDDFAPEYSQTGRKLLYASSLANLRVYTLASENMKRSGMGTTLSALYIEDEEHASIAHIGDSRVYRMRNGVLKQITTDHSYVQQQVALGRMTQAEADNSRIQNILMKALGLKKDSPCDIIDIKLELGDTFILCSDGVNKGISDEDIAKIMNTKKTAAEICSTIVAKSANKDGKDNTSCVAVKVITKKKKSFSSYIKSLFK